MRVSEPFDEFWAAYPLKKNKQGARDAFRWAMQHFNEDGQLLGRLTAAIAWQHREQPEARFWPYPDKWLLKERWTDEPIAVVIVPTARERSDYRQWCFSLGPNAAGVSIEDFVKRQRRIA